MKIAIVRQKYTPYGGAERFVERALDGLRAQGVDVTVIAREWTGQGDGIRCDPFYIGSTWRDAGFARAVRQLLRERTFDLVQSHERIPGCDIYRAGDGVHAEWLLQRKRVLGPMGRMALALSPYHAYTKRAERRLFGSPALRAVICISEMVKEEVQRHFGVAEDKLHVIYNGVDTDKFHPRLQTEHREPVRSSLGWTDEDVVFLFVGSGFERKGLAAAIAALADLPPKAKLMVVGRDKHMHRYAGLVRQFGLESRVALLGGKTDVSPYYGAADAFLLPTLYEPFGNVVLEAMASGLPVVTSTKCGGGELIRDGDEGYVVDALDVAGIAASLRKLMDFQARAGMAGLARRTAEEFTLARTTRALEELYGRLFASRNAVPSA